MVSLLLILFLGGGSVALPPTSLEMIGTMHLAKGPDGGYYFLNREKMTVEIYDADWAFQSEFGGRGTGPGTFGHVVSIFRFEDRVYVRAQNLQTFDLNGRFLRMVRVPPGLSDMAKVQGGWVGLKGDLFTRRTTVIHFDDDFLKETTLQTFDAPTWDIHNFGNRSSDLKVTQDGQVVFVTPRGEPDQVWRYDVSTGNSRFLDLGLPRLLVSDGFRETYIRETKKGMKRFLKPGVSIKVGDVHPGIRAVRQTYTDKLVLFLWHNHVYQSLKMGLQHEVNAGMALFLDQQGKQVQPVVTDFYPYKVIDHLEDGIVHVGYDAAEDVYRLYKTPEASFQDAMKHLSKEAPCNSCD